MHKIFFFFFFFVFLLNVNLYWPVKIWLLQVIAILDKIKNEKKTAVLEDDYEVGPSDAPKDDRDWENDDLDEDIIYIK